jgi:hypothetical protein
MRYRDTSLLWPWGGGRARKNYRAIVANDPGIRGVSEKLAGGWNGYSDIFEGRKKRLVITVGGVIATGATIAATFMPNGLPRRQRTARALEFALPPSMVLGSMCDHRRRAAS